MNLLIAHSIAYLYFLTFEVNLLSTLKNKTNVIQTFLKLTDTKTDEVQFNAYRMLAVLMNEDDIKNLANPNKITSVFIKSLKQVIDPQPGQRRRLQNSLVCLKSLVQHEQVKAELAKQSDGLPLLIRCATDTKFDVANVRVPALEILWAMTFNEEAAVILKNDHEFMKYVKTLLSSKENVGLQTAADGILWKLEKEAQFVVQQHEPVTLQVPSTTSAEVTTKIKAASVDQPPVKFDVMISYSHSDKDLCYEIRERLVKDNFQVWLDRDNLYGSTMQAMADAIEHSEVVLICMSDAYKQSVYCQSEAHYAFERRRRLIPLVMKQKYRPDGWLGFVVSGKIYVDFPKMGIDLAYEKLKAEIMRRQHHSSTSSNNTTANQKPPFDREQILELQHHPTAHHIAAQAPVTSSFSQQYSYPTCVTLFTKQNVQDFLSDKMLNVMFPICGQMDGNSLFKTYQMCEKNFAQMYQSLKTELFDLHNKILPLDVYMHFVKELSMVLPNAAETSTRNLQLQQSSYPTCVTLFTEDNVQHFLVDKKLDAMLPLCEQMDGDSLLKTYQMCERNFDLMYQSLKSELFDLHNKILPLNVYLRFVKEVKKYVPN
ncbi:unnamed protein product [Didymodactylos carnosus]|uniref:TIR domain-containing protein n=1 Tax=Didymodactylos carnosus TaxID=1234261 RepID=A0A8S2TPU5_9BILA|nr:unnamed protein product [Didymodactylos carnosus]CAF4293038.1 unnamed protein product [Didymodactylos carnosus]